MDTERIKTELKKLLDSGNLTKKQIYILGANEEAACFIKVIGSKRVQAILDSCERIHCLKLCGKPIQYLEEALVPYSPQKVILLTNAFSGRDIDKLNMMGYLHNVQRFWICEPLINRETMVEQFARRINNHGIFKLFNSYVELIRAKKVLKELYLQGIRHIYFSPYPSVGDIYIYGQYLRAGEIQYDENTTLLVCGNACMIMAQECGFKRVGSLKSELMIQISKIKCIVGDEQKSLESLHYDYYPPVSVMLSSVYRNNVTFDELFEKLKFETPYELSKKIINPDEEKVIEYCKEKGIIKGKSVILAPYAKSVPALSIVFWEDLTVSLKKAGYKVFMNKGGDTELDVYGTISISPPFSLLGEIVEYAGAIISLRSGICDICSYTNAKKIVLYPKQTAKFGERYIKHVGFSNFPYITRLTELECDVIPDKEFKRKVIQIIDNL